jgi:hypothetical protein
MAIEDDITALQEQIASLSSQISTLNSTVSGFSSRLAACELSIADLSDAVALSPYNTVPSQLGEIQNMTIDDDGNLINPSSAGAAGESQAFSRGDHVHPGDTSRAPITDPIFLGRPMSAYTPDLDSTDADSLVIANTMFVKKLCLRLIGNPDSGTVVTPPPNSGEATAPSQSGGNSENLNIGGGGLHGTGGAPGGAGGASGAFLDPAEDGDDGIDGTDGEGGAVIIYGIASGESLNWDIATYVHTVA